MSLYLAIDQGSHASRALLFDNKGAVIKSQSENIDTHRNDKGWVEHDASQLLGSVNKVVSALFNSLSAAEKKDIVACGLAIQRSTVISWSRDGESLSPVISWQDVRAADYLATLKRHDRKIQNITGLPLSAYYGASKLQWLLNSARKNKMVELNQLRLSPLVSYLIYHIVESKPYFIDHTNAQRTQLMDIHRLQWSKKLLGWFGLSDQYLPALKPVNFDYGCLNNTRIHVRAVCGDQNAAFYGVGNIGDDAALVNVGSGAFIVRSMQTLASSDNQLTGIASSDEHSVMFVREATVNGAGSALSWFAEQYNISDLTANLEGWLERGEQPPLFINTVGGLGSPWWRQGRSAEFIDNDQHDVQLMSIAVVESIVFMLFANLDIMNKEATINKLYITGGLSVLDGLCQKLANLSGFTVLRSNQKEATARGVAWLAAGRPGGWCQPKIETKFDPMNDDQLFSRYIRFLEIIEMSADE